jgi:hypothetical protein
MRRLRVATRGSVANATEYFWTMVYDQTCTWQKEEDSLPFNRHVEALFTGLRIRVGSLRCTESSEALQPSRYAFLLGALSKLWELCKFDTVGSCAKVCKY